MQVFDFHFTPAMYATGQPEHRPPARGITELHYVARRLASPDARDGVIGLYRACSLLWRPLKLAADLPQVWEERSK